MVEITRKGIGVDSGMPDFRGPEVREKEERGEEKRDFGRHSNPLSRNTHLLIAQVHHF